MKRERIEAILAMVSGRQSHPGVALSDDEAEALCRMALASLQYVGPAWIPVIERLPDDDAIVYLPVSKTIHVAFVGDDGNWYNPHGDGERVFAKPDSSNGPSHWMPLPSGPISRPVGTTDAG